MIWIKLQLLMLNVLLNNKKIIVLLMPIFFLILTPQSVMKKQKTVIQFKSVHIYHALKIVTSRNMMIVL